MPGRDAPHASTRKLALYLVLLAPFVGTLWVPFFNSDEPRLGGFPFFYWYQFAWIALSSILTGVVYFATREPDPPPGTASPGETVPAPERLEARDLAHPGDARKSKGGGR